MKLNKYIKHGFSKTYVIAEACDNHFGSIENALEMVKQAKLAGADAIKFQHHIAYEEMLKDSPMSDNFKEPLFDFLEKNALKLSDHKALMDYCAEIGIDYLCTPFSLKAAQELNDMGVFAFKIGSGELTDIPTLTEIAKMNKPMIISTGMSTFEEIDLTFNSITKINNKLILFNTVSEYPPKYEDMNLRVINEMIDRYNVVIGHSDHTPDNYTSFAAVALGAKLIEKHVTLDKKFEGPDQSVSIDFMDLYDLVQGIRKIELGLGDEKKIHEKEEQIRLWAHRSIVAVKELEAGTIITRDMIWSKRPGNGIPSNQMDLLVGKKLKKRVFKNNQISWDDFQ
jgi:N-acetylneuraminate synthase